MARRKSLPPLCEQIAAISREPAQRLSTPNFGGPLVRAGCAVLHLACSDTLKGAFLAGRIVNLIGDKSSGKTFISLHVLAEAANNDAFDNYELIHDDVEAASSFDIERLFGAKLTERIKPPHGDHRAPEHSETIQDFEMYIDDALKEGPCIYVLDSLDSLTDLDEEKVTQQNLRARRAGKPEKGTYGMQKAKNMSRLFRLLKRRIEETGSILIVISQVRENITSLPMAPRYKRSGGKALGHNCSHEIWLANIGMEKARGRVTGYMCKAKVTKNKLTGKLRVVEFPVYYSCGVDDMGACVDFLLAEKVWSQPKGSSVVTAFDVGFKGPRARLIRHIEANDLEPQVRELVQSVWWEVEESIKVVRKAKYE